MRDFAGMVAFLGLYVPDLTWFEPGPSLPDVPGRFVGLTRYGGPGEELEGVMDAVSWQIRAVGNQMDYRDAENLADTLDRAMLGITTNNIGGVHIAGVQRIGGPPSALLLDDADRTHFVCSYAVSTEFHPGDTTWTPVSGGGGRVFQGHGVPPGSPPVDLSSATSNDFYLDLDSGILYDAVIGP